MPDRMPNRMSEDMSDRISEDLPIKKYIHIMVGIKRNKIIYIFNRIIFILIYLLKLQCWGFDISRNIYLYLLLLLLLIIFINKGF